MRGGPLIRLAGNTEHGNVSDHSRDSAAANDIARGRKALGRFINVNQFIRLPPK